MDKEPAENKKLIEVALPLDKINPNFEHEKNINSMHPKNLHQWWARRPFSAARAVLWASIVDDPSSHPEEFPTPEAQERERERLFEILEDLSDWKKSNDAKVIEDAREELKKYLGNNLNKEIQFLDPFSGGGAIPFEAQRLGLKGAAFDLNPVAVLINKAMIEIPPRFTGIKPVNKRDKRLISGQNDLFGVSQDLKYYGALLKQLAYEKVKDIYPTSIAVPEDLGGGKAEIFSWIWVYTLKCPNPICGCETPLYLNCILDGRKSNEAYLRPYYDNNKLLFKVMHEKFHSDENKGTMNRQGAICAHCRNLINREYIRDEGIKHKLSRRLVAIVSYKNGERLYLNPDFEEEEKEAKVTLPEEYPSGKFANNPQNLGTGEYGLANFEQLFSNRQMQGLVALCTSLNEIRNRIEEDAIYAGMEDDKIHLRDGGKGALAYSEALSVYLAFAIDKEVASSNVVTRWENDNALAKPAFSRQSLYMQWMTPEVNIFGGRAGSFKTINDTIAESLLSFPCNIPEGIAKQHNAQEDFGLKNVIISTDPPYYDNIQYADISDFYYIWLRFNLKDIYPNLFKTTLTPKQEEIVAQPYRYGRKEEAKKHFESGMQKAMENIYSSATPDIPVTIYYAYKQSETEAKKTSSSGWETMLNAIIKAGFSIKATWPLKTENPAKSNLKINMLTTSVVIVCRKKEKGDFFCTKRQFLKALREGLKPTLTLLQETNLAPVDLAQSAIGPGMAIFSKYDKVLSADGSEMTVKEALQAINEEVGVCLNEFGEALDNESRFCIALYLQCEFNDIKSGDADILALAKDTSISKLKNDGIVEAGKGMVRLTPREKLPEIKGNDDIWLLCHRLVFSLEKNGIKGCAKEMRKIQGTAALGKIKNLAYELYTISERKNWNQEAYLYNSLVVSWADIASEASKRTLL